MTRLTRAVAASCTALLLGACGVLPQPDAPPAMHDFGPQAAEPSAAALAAQVTVLRVDAPSWLANARIHYRLLYDEPTRLRAYAQNRWIAPPQELLRVRLQLAFDRAASAAPGAAPQPMFGLQVELLDLEQVFRAADTARVTLRAVATLHDATGKPVLGPHSFDIDVASSPDVQGAVQGSAAAAARLLEQIVRWTSRSVPLVPRSGSGTAVTPPVRMGAVPRTRNFIGRSPVGRKSPPGGASAKEPVASASSCTETPIASRPPRRPGNSVARQ